jgi:hypothetical protein
VYCWKGEWNIVVVVAIVEAVHQKQWMWKLTQKVLPMVPELCSQKDPLRLELFS